MRRSAHSRQSRYNQPRAITRRAASEAGTEPLPIVGEKVMVPRGGVSELSHIKVLHWQTRACIAIDPKRLFGTVANRQIQGDVVGFRRGGR